MHRNGCYSAEGLCISFNFDQHFGHTGKLRAQIGQTLQPNANACLMGKEQGKFRGNKLVSAIIVGA